MAKTEILLLGTFHFMESSIDFYSDEVQSQLDKMVHQLLKFNPDAIAVEAAAHEQKAIDESYEKFSLADLNDFKKMETEILGTINMFNCVCPITYNNESLQIGYRLGKLLNMNYIYAIDDDMMFDMDIMDFDLPSLIETRKMLSEEIALHKNDSLMDLYKFYNSEKWMKLSHSTYIQANGVNKDNHYDGAVMVSKWYERNLKIFSNIQNLVRDKQCQRLFILYGAGHLQILRDLIKADDNLKLVEPCAYLPIK